MTNIDIHEDLKELDLSDDIDYLIMMGNPGSGKSTLLNSIIGKVVFKNGFSAGGGLTQKLQLFEYNNIKYGDTPGLNDIKSREQAAREICSALRQTGTFVLVFVITLESGRLKPDDLSTMSLILNSFKKDLIHDIRYNVLINKVKPRHISEDLLIEVSSYLNQMIFKPSLIKCIPESNDLDGDNIAGRAPKELIEALTECETMEIRKEGVSNIEVKDWEPLRAEFQKKLEELADRYERQRKEFESFKMKSSTDVKFKTRTGVKIHNKSCPYISGKKDVMQVVNYNKSDLCLYCFNK